MSRDFIGSQPGRSFRQSTNRDRITRAGTALVDWLVFVQPSPDSQVTSGNSYVLLSGMAATPAPPAGAPTDSFTNSRGSMVFPNIGSIYCHANNPLSQFGAVFSESVIGRSVNFSNSGISSRLPPGPTSGYFRATFRCWGVFVLANISKSAAPTAIVRFGTVPIANSYPPPDYTIYDKNPIATFNFSNLSGTAQLIVDDFPSLGGIPLNTFTLDSSIQSETKQLYWMDRVITISVRIADTSQGFAQASQGTIYAGNEIDGAIIQLTGTSNKAIAQHRPIFFPNGTLLNPANPVQTLDSSGSVRTNVFPTGQSDGMYYTSMGMMVHLEPLSPIPSYAPPTLTILRQQLLP